MKISRTDTGYILQHESGEYFHSCIPGSSPLSYSTDDPLKAIRYLFKSTAEQVVANAKVMEPRWDGEKTLKDFLIHCTPKKITVNVEAEVEE